MIDKINNRKKSQINSVNPIEDSLKNISRIYSLEVQNQLNNIFKISNSISNIHYPLNHLNEINSTVSKTVRNITTTSLAIEEAQKSIVKNELMIRTMSQQANEAINQILKAQRIFQNIDLNQILSQYASLINYNYRFQQYVLDHETQINFGAKIIEILNEIDDEDIKEIFHTKFLNKLIVSENLWILPRLTINEYKELSQMNIEENTISLKLFERYINEPHTVYNIIKNWNLDNQRKKIITQIYDNYLLENYETVIIMLTIQIEGILIDNLDIKKILENKQKKNKQKKNKPKNKPKLYSSDLRIELEDKMEISLDNIEDSWDYFIKKSNIAFISYIMWPLYKEIDFVEEDEINRNQISHKGVINLDKEDELNQIIAIRFFILLDTVIYMIDELKKDNLL